MFGAEKCLKSTVFGRNITSLESAAGRASSWIAKESDSGCRAIHSANGIACFTSAASQIDGDVATE